MLYHRKSLENFWLFCFEQLKLNLVFEIIVDFSLIIDLLNLIKFKHLLFIYKI